MTISIITVLRNGCHRIHQIDSVADSSSTLVGAHLALRERHYPQQMERFVVVAGAEVSEHFPAT